MTTETAAVPPPQNHVVWLSDTRAKRGGLPGVGFYVRDGRPGPNQKAKGPYATKREALDHIDGDNRQAGTTTP